MLNLISKRKILGILCLLPIISFLGYCFYHVVTTDYRVVVVVILLFSISSLTFYGLRLLAG